MVDSQKCRQCGKTSQDPGVVAPYTVMTAAGIKGEVHKFSPQAYTSVWLCTKCVEPWHERYRAWAREKVQSA